MLDKVREIISEQLGINPDDITPDSSFTDDLGADSLDIVELLMAFSDRRYTNMCFYVSSLQAYISCIMLSAKCTRLRPRYRPCRCGGDDALRWPCMPLRCSRRHKG